MIAGSEVTDELEAEIFKINEGMVNDWGNEKKVKLLEKSIKCTNCQGFYNECITHGILNLILNKEYGVEMEPEEFNKILFDNDFIYGNVNEEIKKYATKNKENALE